jgi:hypothetical protein
MSDKPCNQCLSFANQRNHKKGVFTCPVNQCFLHEIPEVLTTDYRISLIKLPKEFNNHVKR